MSWARRPLTANPNVRCTWGHDVTAPRLELPAAQSKKALGITRAIARVWGSYYDVRHDPRAERMELRRTYAGRWPKQGVPLLLPLAWRRSNATELHVRFAQLLGRHVDVRTGQVGLVDAAGQLAPFNYGQLMERLACSEGQLKRTIKDFRAANYIRRFQGRDHDPQNKRRPYRARVAEIRILGGFWHASGVADVRARWIAKRARKEADATAAAAEAERKREARLRDRLWRRVEAKHPGIGWGETGRLVDVALGELLKRRRPPPT